MLQLGKVFCGDPPFTKTLKQMTRIPSGGGLRSLGIRELSMEDDPLDPIGELPYLNRIDTRPQAIQQRRKSLVRIVSASISHNYHSTFNRRPSPPLKPPTHPNANLLP
jgi:hypothetical protein